LHDQRRKERVKERVTDMEQKSTARPMEKPIALFVPPLDTLLPGLLPPLMRQTPTLPYQPDDRGSPASASAAIPLKDSPDGVLQSAFVERK
jgi:hypothetical protein